MSEPTRPFVVCHVREVRTYITVQATHWAEAIDRAREVYALGSGTLGEPPLQDVDDIRTEDSDAGEFRAHSEL